MFPSQRPQYLHWTELPRKPPKKRQTRTRKRGSSPAAAPVMQMVSIPIPFKESTTAPSRFGALTSANADAGANADPQDFSHLTISRNPFQQKQQQSQQQSKSKSKSTPTSTRRTLTDYDYDYSFANEDYITFAEKLLPRLPTPTASETTVKSDVHTRPSTPTLTSTSGVSSQFRPGDVGIGGGGSARSTKEKFKSKSLNTSTPRKKPGETGTDGLVSPSSSVSVGSITSSIVKPIEIKFRNKKEVAGTRKNVGTTPGLQILEDKTESQLALLCACDSDIERSVRTQMAHKTEADRELMIKLCNAALRRRESKLEQYTGVVDGERKRMQATVDKYRPDMGKAELQDLMLGFVKHRQDAFKQLEQRSGLGFRPPTCWHKKSGVNDGRQYLPVYCLDGKTHFGRGKASIEHQNIRRQTHTFAQLANLKNPVHDPPGYRRYSKLINMEGFDDHEILIHARGNKIRFDGFGKANDDDQNGSTTDLQPEMQMLRRKSKTISLPEGVYPERLSIGRSSAGVLVVQEPWNWKF